jgi:hypothetical protein
VNESEWLTRKTTIAKRFALTQSDLGSFRTATASTSGNRGELVPQDPNDEPAEKLLQRICTGTKMDRK